MRNEQIIEKINDNRVEAKFGRKLWENLSLRGVGIVLEKLTPERTTFDHYDPKKINPHEKTPPPHSGSQPRGTSLEGADAGTIRNRQEQLNLETKALKGLKGLKVNDANLKGGNSNNSALKSYVGALTSGAGKAGKPREGGGERG